MLKESFTGFNKCYKAAGPFTVTSEMIGVNNNGKPRVWMN